ncbi:MAG: hypothetical protein DRR08_21685 [Candidatus Parabeggiatoa sp. nov. 2]|nr:MAG: hypothetical protein B6247_23400 [Beggiatoa sp. 4572_84]RKZ56458.1 MAG: hypothetical protein DRR08_21685 [Gammaproteobacteria bacterium]HEC84438.1 hypothetical protein [Thioploca sp.]
MFVYEDDDIKATVVPSDKVMAIDLGLNNLATCVTNGVTKPFIIDGRRLKSINHHYNKRFAKLQSHLKKTRNRKWSNRLQRLTDRRNARISDYLHKATHQVTSICVENGISKVVVGDVAKSLDQINLGKKNNQNVVNLSLGQFIDKLRYKLELHGIALEVLQKRVLLMMILCLKNTSLKRHTHSAANELNGVYIVPKMALLSTPMRMGRTIFLRLSNPKFSFSELAKKVSEGILDWLLTVTRLKV